MYDIFRLILWFSCIAAVIMQTFQDQKGKQHNTQLIIYFTLLSLLLLSVIMAFLKNQGMILGKEKGFFSDLCSFLGAIESFELPYM